MVTTAPARGTSPPPPANRNGTQRPVKTFGRSSGTTRVANRILIYGTGGIGKSSLAACAPAPIFADIERGTEDLGIDRVTGIESWADLRLWLQTGDFDGVETIVIDSITKAEEWCARHVVDTVLTEKGSRVTSIEGYGFGKGYVHIFEEFKKLLIDLDAHYRQGRNIVLIGHERIGRVPNPNGEDYIRYEPRLQNSDKANIMLATKEWCDHVWFVSYDVSATDGKAKGSGTRTIYLAETATYMAKSRSLDSTPLEFPKGDRGIWNKLNNQGTASDDAPPM